MRGPRFDQRHGKTARVEGLKAIIAQPVGGIEQLGGELDASRAAAHDHDLDADIAVRIVAQHARGPQALVEQALAKLVRLAAAVEEQAVLAHAGRAEIVGD